MEVGEDIVIKVKLYQEEGENTVGQVVLATSVYALGMQRWTQKAPQGVLAEFKF